MKKKFTQEPPTVASLGGEENTNLFIRERWDKLREYEDRLAASSRNSSRSPSSDTPEARAERKWLSVISGRPESVRDPHTPPQAQHSIPAAG